MLVSARSCQLLRSAEAWGELRGCDAAVLIEVIEHLDPGPLAALAPALLGALRPRVLVVSTPNRSYNAVMAAMGLPLLHNGLRNCDHRFEWCALFNGNLLWGTVV